MNFFKINGLFNRVFNLTRFILYILYVIFNYYEKFDERKRNPKFYAIRWKNMIFCEKLVNFFKLFGLLRYLEKPSKKKFQSQTFF